MLRRQWGRSGGLGRGGGGGEEMIGVTGLNYWTFVEVGIK